jgi:hypothetical protein
VSSIRDGVTEVGTWAREVVARRAAVVAAVDIVLRVTIHLGALGPSAQAAVDDWMGTVFDGIAGLAAIVWSRSGVTPAALSLRPRLRTGRALVPAPERGGERLAES